MLADQEAEALAKALVEIERLYPTQLDPRVFAWINLVGTAGMIYGTRVFAIQSRLATERDERRRETRPSAEVTPLYPQELMPVTLDPTTGQFFTSQN